MLNYSCRAAASIAPDGRTFVISNMESGFDIYDLDTMAALGHLSNDVGGAIRAVPVTFVQGANIIIGGSTAGEVYVWDATTHRVHQVLLHRGT